MNNRTHSTASFSLVEITLALGIAAFCLIALFGLMPVGLKTDQSAIRQTTANGILSAIVADLRATPLTSNTSKQFGISMRSADDSGGSATTLCCDEAGRCFLTSSGVSGEGASDDGGGSGTS